MANKYIFFAFISMTVLSCAGHGESTDETEAAMEVVTPVTVSHPERGSIRDTVSLKAVSAFLLKTSVKATANGYLEISSIQLGSYVNKGQLLFTLKTKEAKVLGNTINDLDSSLDFHGTIAIRSTSSGYITQLTATSGSYVMDGEQLAEITDNKSFSFLLDLPYELKPYVDANRSLELRLPDNTVLNGFVQSALPTMDSVAQTQRYIIKVKTGKLIPENLIANVNITKSLRLNALLLPKEALLANEEQTAFWIMQLVNDSTAVKVQVKKGLETNEKVEIISPALTDSARVIITGNYGLTDTAKIKITEE